jgi:hypothetical protein
MGYFLLGKRRDTGALELVNDTLYPSREDAIDALAEIEVSPDIESEVFAVDLAAATPVVVVQKKSAAEPVADEAIAAAIVEDAEAPPEAESGAAGAWEAPPEDEEGAGLHTALQGAAASLEGEGIVAPESIGPADEAKAWPWEPGKEPPSEEEVAESELDEAIAEATVPEEPIADDVVAEPPVVAQEAGAQAVAEEVPGEEPVAEEAAVEPAPAEAAEYVPDLLEEPAVSVGEMVATPESEDIDAGHAVIMGDYEEPAADEAVEAAPEPAPAPETGPVPAPDHSGKVITDSEPGGPEFSGSVPEPENTQARDNLESVLADLEIEDPVAPEPEMPEPAAEDLPGLDVPADLAAEIPAAPVADETSTETEEEPGRTHAEAPDLLAEVGGEAGDEIEPGFEGGSSDIADLTCDDCVYMNTCPKVGDSDPASCGSFQWKSS